MSVLASRAEAMWPPVSPSLTSTELIDCRGPGATKTSGHGRYLWVRGMASDSQPFRGRATCWGSVRLQLTALGFAKLPSQVRAQPGVGVPSSPHARQDFLVSDFLFFETWY